LAGGKVSTIFDIGANRGDTILKYHSLFPAAQIYGFEPFPDSFQLLKGNVENIPNVKIFQNAIADTEGDLTFYVNSSIDTNSLLPSKKSGLSSDEHVVNKAEIMVNATTIDRVCGDNKIDGIGILKMDIQGGELNALKGAKKLLSEKKIQLIYSEAFFQQQYVDQPLFHDISKYLAAYDYHIQDFYEPYYGNGRIAWCDVIFLPAR
jgi:FkbM family methyltransferase